MLDVDGYFGALLAYLDHAVSEGFLAPEHRSMLVVERDPGRLIDALASRRPPPDRWTVAPGA
jgi:predicted Rossmann-fold nucleotide-binding protein